MWVPAIRIPKGLLPYKANSAALKKLKASTAYNLLTARIAVSSASSRLSWAYAAAHDAAQLALAHYGYRPAERIRRDTASLAGVAALSVGTELADLAGQLGSLLDIRNAIYHGGLTRVSSGEADEAFRQAEQFCSLADSFAAQSIRIPLAAACDISSQQFVTISSRESVQVPLHVLDAALDMASVLSERWIALQIAENSPDVGRHPEPDQERGLYVIVDRHRALPCNGEETDALADDRIICVSGDRLGLRMGKMTFGFTREVACRIASNALPAPQDLENPEIPDQKDSVLEFVFDLLPKLEAESIVLGMVVCTYNIDLNSRWLAAGTLEISSEHSGAASAGMPPQHGSKKTTDEQDTTMCVLWEQGWFTLREIADKFGVSTSTARSRIFGEPRTKAVR